MLSKRTVFVFYSFLPSYSFFPLPLSFHPSFSLPPSHPLSLTHTHTHTLTAALSSPKEFDAEIMREMGQLGVLGPTIKGQCTGLANSQQYLNFNLPLMQFFFFQAMVVREHLMWHMAHSQRGGEVRMGRGYPALIQTVLNTWYFPTQ